MESVEILIISTDTAGDIRKNQIFMENILENSLIDDLLDSAVKGTPLLKIGNGNPILMLTAGIHGNELPPQIAALKVAESLKSKKIKGTVFIIPFAIPHATMRSSRRFKGFDMNRKASTEGYISNEIINIAKSVKVDSLADFHATKPLSNPGVESIFCSKKPSPQSFKIAEHINKVTGSKLISHAVAGKLYNGALEDECNLLNIPAVTCEVVSQNNRVDPGSYERSYLQMMAYLDYFKVLS